ncbi:MAG: hypothetical protein KJ579_04440, partial [Verrucomicrobia bacterium]|nr:hypothetical protein [Verrucomicrobiota bacterium]
KHLDSAYVDGPQSRYMDSQGRRGALLVTGRITKLKRNVVVAQGAVIWGSLAAIYFDIHIVRSPFGWCALLRRPTGYS